jgi:hypothetical protein
MVKKYLIVGKRVHSDLRKENSIFQAVLISSNDNVISCSGFKVTETEKNNLALSNITFKLNESITFNKNDNNRTEILYFDLKFDQKMNIYSGSWQSNTVAHKKKGTSFLFIFEIDKNIDFDSKLSNLALP